MEYGGCRGRYHIGAVVTRQEGRGAPFPSEENSMKRAALAGVRITQGPSDWQILQRRMDNTADIPLVGTWLDPADRRATVEARVVA